MLYTKPYKIPVNAGLNMTFMYRLERRNVHVREQRKENDLSSRNNSSMQSSGGEFHQRFTHTTLDGRTVFREQQTWTSQRTCSLVQSGAGIKNLSLLRWMIL